MSRLHPVGGGLLLLSLIAMAAVVAAESDSAEPPAISGGGVRWTWGPLDGGVVPVPEAPNAKPAAETDVKRAVSAVENGPAVEDVPEPAAPLFPEPSETASTDSTVSHAITTTATATNEPAAELAAPLSATDVPLSTTNAPVPAADVSAAGGDSPVAATNAPAVTADAAAPVAELPAVAADEPAVTIDAPPAAARSTPPARIPSDPTRNGDPAPDVTPARPAGPRVPPDKADLSAMTAPEPRLPAVPVKMSAAPPSEEDAQAGHNPLASGQVTVPANVTALEAIQSVFDQTHHVPVLTLVPTNVLPSLETDPCVFSTDRPVKWDQAIGEIIRPYPLDFHEEEQIVRFGLHDDIEVLRGEYEHARLERNHTRMQNVNFSGGLEIYEAVCFIQEYAKVNVTFDYLQTQQARQDFGLLATQRGDPPVAAEGEEAPPPPPPEKKTTYRTPEGVRYEWRTVLAEVLEPHGYGFVEVRGTVRILTRADVAKHRQALINARPLVTRIVRVRHADPEKIVTLLSGKGGCAPPVEGDPAGGVTGHRLLKHSLGVIQVAQPWNEDSKRYIGSAGGETLRTGGRGGGEMGGAPRLTINYGQLNRPTTPPSILIRDVEENLDNVEQRIRELDKPGRQILIEARVLDLGQNADRELGLKINEFGGTIGPVRIDMGHSRTERDTDSTDYSFNSSLRSEEDDVRGFYDPAPEESGDRYSSVDTWHSDSTLSRTLTSTFGKDRSFSRLATLTPFQMEATWRALQDAGDTKVVSQPIIVVGDHSEAVIRVATMEPVLNLTVDYLNENPNAVQSYEWQTLSVGITLWVLPEICADAKSIRLGVHPQVTEKVGESVEAPDGSKYPILEARELDTRVIVPDGNTLLMGGLLKSTGTFTERKVPILGDIPLLSFLFRWRQQVDKKRNLVMLITPTILGEELPGTGYEQPTLDVSDPALSTMGRNVKQENHRKLKTALDRVPAPQDEEPAAEAGEESGATRVEAGEETPAHTESSGEAVSSSE